MFIHPVREDLINVQQMEVAVNGPNGATHLILCTGVANLGIISHETYTFFVGPQISRRQFVDAVASGALVLIHAYHKNPIRENAHLELGVNLILIGADFDDESYHVKVRTEVSSTQAFGRKGNYLIVTIILTQFTDEIRLGGRRMIRIQKLSSK